jgi:16S rRNA (guanine527-N7)-methyltransferase
VLEVNRRFNLTGAKSAEELVAHIADSLTIVPYLRAPYIDVGSGAGLPAIPAAIAAAIPVTMVEATSKKARFLASALQTLGLAGRVVAERAEIAGWEAEFREHFESATGRALGPASTVVELLLPFLRPSGVAVLQRGTLDASERAALEDAALMLGGRFESEHLLSPARRIVLIRKLGSTPARFPRRPGIPAKHPLCVRRRVPGDSFP